MSGTPLTIGYFPDGEREPDAIEFAVMAWLDNNGFDLVANDLCCCIEDRFEKIKKNDFLKYAANYIQSLSSDPFCDYAINDAICQLNVLREHWFGYLKIYNE